MLDERSKILNFPRGPLFVVKRKSDYQVGGNVVEISLCEFDFLNCLFCIVESGGGGGGGGGKALNAYTDSIDSFIVVKFEFFFGYAFWIALYRPLLQA